MPIGTLAPRVSVLNPSMSSWASGCSTNISRALRVLFDVGPRGSQRQPAIGVGAQRRLAAAPRAPRARSRSPSLSGFTPILSLKKWKPSRSLACASATSCSAVGLPRSHIGCTRVAPRTADQIDQAPAGRSPDQIEDRHLDRRMGAAIADAARGASRAKRRPCAGVLARRASARDGRAPPRPARPACRRSWSARTRPRPSRRCRRPLRSAPAGSARSRWSRPPSSSAP